MVEGGRGSGCFAHGIRLLANTPDGRVFGSRGNTGGGIDPRRPPRADSEPPATNVDWSRDEGGGARERAPQMVWPWGSRLGEAWTLPTSGGRPGHSAGRAGASLRERDVRERHDVVVARHRRRRRGSTGDRAGSRTREPAAPVGPIRNSQSPRSAQATPARRASMLGHRDARAVRSTRPIVHAELGHSHHEREVAKEGNAPERESQEAERAIPVDLMPRPRTHVTIICSTDFWWA